MAVDRAEQARLLRTETFAEVKLPQAAAILAPLTARHPDLSVDVYVNLGVAAPDVSAIRATALIQGAPDAIGRAVERLVEVYGIRPEEGGSEPGRRILTFDIQQSRLRQGILGAIVAVQGARGPAWLHISHGSAFLRCPADEEPDAVAERVAHVLRVASSPGKVSLVGAAAFEMDTWRRLVLAGETFLDD